MAAVALILLVGTALLVVGALAVVVFFVVSGVRDRRQWRGPDLAPSRPADELQDPALADRSEDIGESTTQAWHAGQAAQRQAGGGNLGFWG